ncbi:MAG: DUF1788 domain-containing protein, partial [Candidatus Uhrbacteria bacterium]|nr:DUF1788 domain-containing protein [Candidatus Uhrbacteria bacterium]
MNRVKRLLGSYAKFIAVPWREDAAAAQRVIFCVYNEGDELRLRARIDEFELGTRQAGHEWALFDLTDSFPDWLTGQRYAERYFRQQDLLPTFLPKYLDHIVERFEAFLSNRGVDENSVVALKGVGTLFGFLKVKSVVDKLAPLVPGRLVV